MLVTQQPVFRRFWYALMPMSELGDAPRPFRLLGEDIVLWNGPDGAPAAVADRCCHRTAKLSHGWCEDGNIVCGYHGWTYRPDGLCVKVPQARNGAVPSGARVKSYHCAERYGYVWVALEEPLYDIPALPEAAMTGFRQFHEFWEEWDAPGLRIMENSFDNAHFSFVHRASFGIIEEPEPQPMSITDTDDGFVMRTIVPVQNPDIQKRNLRESGDRTVRNYEKTWWMPFSRKMKITYPNGLVHILITLTAPIDDRRSILTQFAVRNDTEADAPAEGVIAFDRQVTHEDRAILEACDWDVPLDLRRREELHMWSDRPGLEMRKRLMKLLAAHGEREARTTGTPDERDTTAAA